MSFLNKSDKIGIRGGNRNLYKRIILILIERRNIFLGEMNGSESSDEGGELEIKGGRETNLTEPGK